MARASHRRGPPSIDRSPHGTGVEVFRELLEADRRGRQQKELEAERDPYAVSPEDVLDTARREVKRWRLEQPRRHPGAHPLARRCPQAARREAGRVGGGVPDRAGSGAGVLPVTKRWTGIDLPGEAAAAGSDFEALYHLARLAYGDRIDELEQLRLWQEEAA